MSYPPFTKDPDAVLDYGIDWSDWLTSETILASSWTVPIGLTPETFSNTATTTTVRLLGGKLGQSYDVINHITTSRGQQEDRTFTVKIENR